MARKPAKQPDVFSTTARGDPRGMAGFRRNVLGAVQPLADTIHDGDTIMVQLNGSGGLRFLGIDTAEVALGTTKLTSPRLLAKFADPAILALPGIEPALQAHLRPLLGPDCLPNHLRHAQASRQALQAMVEADMAALGKTVADFRLYLAFSYEVFDGRGRLLVFVNRDEPQAAGPRPLSYNERQLRDGMAQPYFIWPNIAPFRDAKTVLDAVPPPGGLKALAGKGALGAARAMVAAARQAAQTAKTGVFNPDDPQRLAAFELRFLNERRLPNRPVIDLSQATDTILRPQSYPRIANPEDRLFLPAEFLPAFQARGWKLEGWA